MHGSLFLAMPFHRKTSVQRHGVWLKNFDDHSPDYKIFDFHKSAARSSGTVKLSLVSSSLVLLLSSPRWSSEQVEKLQCRDVFFLTTIFISLFSFLIFCVYFISIHFWIFYLLFVTKFWLGRKLWFAFTYTANLNLTSTFISTKVTHCNILLIVNRDNLAYFKTDPLCFLKHMYLVQFTALSENHQTLASSSDHIIKIFHWYFTDIKGPPTMVVRWTLFRK